MVPSELDFCHTQKQQQPFENGIGKTYGWERESAPMLWTIAFILLVLWVLGLFTNVAGGPIDVLLVAAVILIAVNPVRRSRTG
jgi:hypothetical protein